MTTTSDRKGRSAQAGPRLRRQAGFNLLELLVVLIILGVLLAVAFPSFRFVVNSSRITNPANELLATMQLARMEAIRRNARTVVCRSQNPNAAAPTCTTAAGNWDGWVAFVDTNRDGAVTAGELVLRAVPMNAPATLVSSPAISGASNRVVFRPDGLARTPAGALLAARLRVCVPETTPSDNARDLTITQGSRLVVVRSTAVITSGACAAPANP
ncbi:GspH/FimT family pseudopilin [Arenimonas sp. MALMAid1274]|uniref:GspH/FimT family pseudopilin n=1 Tax=Arenimonas sp. MALMAid1274 TaxID=3411630 RepID=UPI003BA0B234